MTDAPLPLTTIWTRRLTAVLVVISVVVVVASAGSGGYWSLQSAHGCGNTELVISVDRPISTGLRVRYVKAFAREKNVVVANPSHPEFRGKWKELNDDGAVDSVFFAFSTEPRLFGYRTKRNNYADVLVVWYQRDERETFRTVALPGNSEPGPWKIVVPIIEP